MQEILLQDAPMPENEGIEHYLAYLASTPRNSVEMQMEPAVHDPAAHVRPIDTMTREQAAPDGYPPSGLSVWWVILCLDGAPDRMRHHLYVLNSPFVVACQMLAPAEDRFRQIVMGEVAALRFAPMAQVAGPWPDGKIYAFNAITTAQDLFTRVADACRQINHTESLDWEHQFHVRGGIGRSLGEAFSGLLSTKCDQLCCVRRRQDETTFGSIREMYRLA